MELPPRRKLFDFQGVSMTHYFTDNWDNVQNFQARENDIMIATYPKAGTTWISYILDQLHYGPVAPKCQTSLVDRVPFLEMNIPQIPTGIEMLDKLATSARLIKTHLPVQFIPRSFWEQNCRMVYVARNAKDNLVSYFNFDPMNLAQPEPGDWNHFLQRFMDGKMVFGLWYDHVTGWWEKKQTHSKIHCMFYEDMIEDLGRELDRLCSFLGLSPSLEEKARVIEKSQFDNMKKNSMTNHSSIAFMDFKISPFMRKGKVGD
ncbi:hypothetical protein DPEC_G00004570 [Dallia pectoralis]|uniref:Uncharacterized protein n=1 Tax=Dallia pectoralis TaxID=75939 RepID=A0ACC2HKB8_DALPE|nr:hypothetical protein DPEC_G00004570 [Dallia pectoralis]